MGVSTSDTKAATSTERVGQNRMIPRFVSLGETLLGSFVSDLDTMSGLPGVMSLDIGDSSVSRHR